MAYDPTLTDNHNLSRRDMFGQLGDATSRTDGTTTTGFYSYRTVDAAATVEAANYFDAATQLRRGDVILAVMNNAVGQTPVVKKYIVTSGVASGQAHVVIALQTATAG